MVLVLASPGTGRARLGQHLAELGEELALEISHQRTHTRGESGSWNRPMEHQLVNEYGGFPLVGLLGGGVKIDETPRWALSSARLERSVDTQDESPSDKVKTPLVIGGFRYSRVRGGVSMEHAMENRFELTGHEKAPAEKNLGLARAAVTLRVRGSLEAPVPTAQEAASVKDRRIPIFTLLILIDGVLPAPEPPGNHRHSTQRAKEKHVTHVWEPTGGHYRCLWG